MFVSCLTWRLNLQEALELSDDSDIEVHPNVDKSSFIRAKRNQIHADRDRRKRQIATLKYERIINDNMMTRISALQECLKSHAEEAKTGKLGEIAFRAVFESAPKNPDDDTPPPRPEGGVHTGQKEPLPSYSKMMATLLDQVNQTLNEKNAENRYEAMVEEIGVHLSKVEGLQKELLAKLAELEKEEESKITSEDMHIGFDSSHVAKSRPEEKKTETTSKSSVELLNPDYTAPKTARTTADMEDDGAEAKASPAAQKFAAMDANNYSALLEFLSQNPEILEEKETDGLLVMALDAEMEKKPALAHNCVHQALLLQYCRALGKDGVALFFKRITSPGHKAQRLFLEDVKDTYSKIKTSAAKMLAQRTTGDEEVELIQLHAVEPGTAIDINVPQASSDDVEVQRAREIFESFSPEMRNALESGELDEVNKVLAKMRLKEAEEVAGKLSEAGILSLEKDIIDATTGEGAKQMQELEKDVTSQVAAKAEADNVAAKYSADPE